MELYSQSPLTDHLYNASFWPFACHIGAKSLKQSSSASFVGVKWSYPFVHVLQLLLDSEAAGLPSVDTVAVEFEDLNDP